MTTSSSSNFSISSQLGIEPWTSQDRLDYFIETSIEEWQERSSRRYNSYQEEGHQPFTLNFLASEAIKKQQFLVTNVKRLQCLRNEKANWRNQSSKLWLELREIENKSPSLVKQEALHLAKMQK